MLKFTYDDEVVPDSEDLPHLFLVGLMLHRLREECYEVRRAEIRTIDGLFFEMAVQIGQQYRDQSIKSVEIKLEHR